MSRSWKQGMTWTPSHAECLDAFLRSSLLKSNSSIRWRQQRSRCAKAARQSLDFHWSPRTRIHGRTRARERARACALARHRTRVRVHEHARARARLRSSRTAERTKSRRINVTSGLKDREAKQELYRSLFTICECTLQILFDLSLSVIRFGYGIRYFFSNRYLARILG